MVTSRFIFQIRSDDMGNAKTDAEIRASILRVVEPVSGEVTTTRSSPSATHRAASSPITLGYFASHYARHFV